jgi:hypothetical protein
VSKKCPLCIQIKPFWPPSIQIGAIRQFYSFSSINIHLKEKNASGIARLSKDYEAIALPLSYPGGKTILQKFYPT